MTAVYTLEQTAERLHKSRRWLQDFIKANPFYRMAGLLAARLSGKPGAPQ